MKSIITKLQNLLLNIKGWHIFIGAIIVRVAYLALFYSPDYYKNLSDDIAYMNLAVEMINQGIFITDLEQLGLYSSIVGPGIGFLILPVVLVFGKNWLAVFIYTSVVSALIPVLIYKLGKLLSTSYVAVFAALWAIIYVPLIKLNLSCGKDVWMTLLFTAIIYLFLHPNFKKGFKYIIYSAILYVLLIHVDERFLVISPVLFIWLIWNIKIDLKYRVRRTVMFILVCIVFSVPWIVRNYITYDRVVLISVRTAGFTDKLFGYEPKEYFPTHEGRWYLSESQIDSVKNSLFNNAILKKVEQQQIDAIREGKIPHKFSYAETVMASFINFWEPIDINKGYYQTGYRYDPAWSFKHNISVFFTYGVMLLFFFFGIWRLWITRPNELKLIISLILIYSLVHALFIPFTVFRYRIPIDPLIIILGWMAITYFGQKILIQLKLINK
jgi:4-amino-4-deoxy-L-arabinose transferase-like glycosyltransferase